MSKNLEESKQVNIVNWRTPPYSQWAFHNVKSFIPSIVVKNDIHNVNLLKDAPNRLSGAILKPLLDATATDSIVILHKGQIVYEDYANGNNEQTPHILMSATKAVTGLIAGILQHKGAIDLNTTVSTYIPQLIRTSYQHVTLRQLLDMRAGVTFDEEQQLRYDIATNWEPLPEKNAPHGLHSFFSKLEHSGEITESSFNYKSANTDLLGWAIESVTGQTFNTLLSELLWKPMGAEYEAYLTVDQDGAPRSAGGLCATIRDFARIGQLIIDSDVHNSKEIIPVSLVDDILNNGNQEAWANGEWGKAFAPISPNMHYRNGWFVIKDEPEIIFAMGVYGQNLFIDRANNIVIAKFSSWEIATDYEKLPLTHHGVAQIRKALVG